MTPPDFGKFEHGVNETPEATFYSFFFGPYLLKGLQIMVGTDVHCRCVVCGHDHSPDGFMLTTDNSEEEYEAFKICSTCLDGIRKFVDSKQKENAVSNNVGR